MKYIFVLIALLFSTSMWGQTPSDSARIARTQDSLRVIAAERHPKLFEKLVEVEQEIEAAVAKREEIRKEAEASTEPEAYSDVAKMSIKISKLQEKMTFAQQRLNAAMTKERKSLEKESKKKQKQE